MNLDDRIAKLQALLARVQGRSRSPFRALHANGTPAAAPAIVPPVVVREAPAVASSFAVTAAPPAPVLTAVPPSPPEPFAPAPSAPRVQFASPSEPLFAHDELPLPNLPPPRPERSQVRVIDPPPMHVVELEIDPEPLSEPLPAPESFSELSLPGDRPSQAAAADTGPAAVDETLESRSRLVAAAPLLEDEDGSAASDPTIEVAAAEVSSAELIALQGLPEDEEAPSSSRRPISLEQKMREPEEEAPLHLPPPESGKLPAASPAIDLTLPAESRARETPPEPPAPMREAREARAEAERTVAGASVHAATKVEALAEVQVASFVGVPPNADAMKTFGEILDEALAL